MSNHGLTRNADNEPVCRCGYRPDVLDEPIRWGSTRKAQIAVLNHAEALNGHEAPDHSQPNTYMHGQSSSPLRSPNDPFVVTDARYPRAGVRQIDS